MEKFRFRDHDAIKELLDICANSNMTRIPKELFKENSFLEINENLDYLVNCIRSMQNLQEFNMNGVKIKESTLIRILQEYS